MEPKIRLKGFSGEWSSRAIKDVCEVNPKSSLPYEFEYVDLESVVGTEMISHRTERRDSAPSRAQRLAKKGDIFYQTVRPYQKNNYLFDMDETNYVFSTGYAQLRTKINQGYLFTLMQSPSFVNKVLLECTGTSYPAINPTNLSKIKIDIVDNENIQQTIAFYFQYLDSLIRSTTKKIESLKQVKAASLQSMFPQEGETTPRVRFKGYEGEWKKKLVGKLGNTYSGLTGKGKDDFGVGNAHYITFLNVLTNACIDTSILEHVDVKEGESQNSVKKGDLFFNTSSETPEEVGMCAVLDEEVDNVYLNSFCFGFRMTDKNVSPAFFAYLMRSNIGRRIMSILAQGATRYNLSKNNFCNTEILIPADFREQEMIANYLSSLDTQITLQTQRLEKLKQIKSACLDNMFV